MYRNEATIQLVRSRYKNASGEPFELTEGQNEIHDIIFGRQHPRTECKTYTQYGKSDVVSQGLLNRVTAFAEKWCIVAGSIKKAAIIMGYLIGHIFDNEYTAARFVPDKGETIDYIRRHRAKDHLTFKLIDDRISEVSIITAENKRTKDVLDALLGFGSPNIILEESPLISDDLYVGVKRMLGGHKDNFLFELGNAVRRNHFYRTSRDPTYHHITILWRQGVAEGRIKEDFIEEMQRESRKNPLLFKMLYECEFPPEDAMDSGGYLALFTDAELDRFYTPELQLFGELRLGVDVAGGGRNYSVIVVKGRNGAKVLYREQNPDTMAFTGEILTFVKDLKIKPDNVFVDSVGIGKGVYDRLCEQLEDAMSGAKPEGVNFGIEPENNESFVNLRAQSFWRAAEWLKAGAKLKKHESWEELLDIRYKVQSDKKLKIKSKDEMAKMGIESPDVADALALTFAREEISISKKVLEYKQPEFEESTPYSR